MTTEETMRFADHFWNTDICDFTGFEIICQRLQKGRRFVKDYAEFLKQRAQAEEAYGNSLVKVAKSAGGRYEIGTLRQAWEVILNQTELVGLTYLNNAHQLNKEKTRILEFVENLNKRSKDRACQTREANNVKRQKYKQLQEEKRTYYMRCRESASYSDYLKEETEKQNSQQKEFEMIVQKHKNAVQMMSDAKDTYCKNLESFEEYCKEWEKKMEDTCETFQVLEAERIFFLKDSMWSTAYMFSSLHLNGKESFKEIKKGLENIVAATDLDLFIRQKQTGTVRPETFRFQPYEDQENFEAAGSPSTFLKLKILSMRKFLSLSPKQSLSDVNKEGNSSNTTEVFPTSKPIDMTDCLMAINNEYESFDLEEESKPTDGQFFRVLYEYKSENESVISVLEKDVVRLLRKENNEWWEVETKDGRQGYFPANYLEPSICSPTEET
ncbi:proline-serine-threonine phosphatase-interacting protein 1-like isoform X1 [Limulus polyphemus]|uniref:Proline-serine-threonine phosphatase-interacting protein 1-like isoform X1 n=1 Tax=Limulus polyphemus TaxID=6850 RepID=A0ABM1BAR8_LIMPO|nr:proline-serine-threonine phosphatase-interacting protein 1-like isoform X1 [Limulus polyphemus]